jgi:hypothetical protein
MAFAAVAAYINYHTTASVEAGNNPTTPANNSTTTGENNTTSTPQPSLTPTPSQTAQPTPSTTPTTLVTPAPTSFLPDDCKINYQETNRIYDKNANTTQITLYVEVISDVSSYGKYMLYENNFYLKENGSAISILYTNETGEGILVNQDNRQTTYLNFKVPGNYTGGNYELAYFNFPNLLVNWKKLT